MSEPQQRHGKRIGELNGFWALAFKVSQIVVPAGLAAMISLSVWTVQRIHVHDMQIASLLKWQQHDPELLKLQIARDTEAASARRFDAMMSKIDRVQEDIMALKLAIQGFHAAAQSLDPNARPK